MDMKQYIAVDLGAESGRVMLGSVSSDKLKLDEVYRFNNMSIRENGSLRWDFNGLFSEVKIGLGKAVKCASVEIAGIGVDSWGVSFGLIGQDGSLMENPYHYRDKLSDGMVEEACKFLSKHEIYINTGLPLTQINSVYQLLAMCLGNSKGLAKAKNLVFIADLLSYYLCGHIYSEYTLASTSQLMNMQTGEWSREIFDRLHLPISIMPSIVKPGTIVGQLTEKIAEELGCNRVPIIAVASHDTASAVTAIPAGKTHWAFLSSGTWSILGVEVPDAIINDLTYEYQLANEGGVENTIQLLRNIMGLWLVQECKRQWSKEDEQLTYSELMRLARRAKAFAAFLNTDHNDFFRHGNMPRKINNYLVESGQNEINDKGQMIRVILEGLAFRYRWVIEKIERVIGKNIDCLNIIGGGIKNELLCQFTANAIDKKVITGPTEATSIGNILMQAKATGQIKLLSDARELVRSSFEVKEYYPEDVNVWNEQYRKIERQLG